MANAGPSLQDLPSPLSPNKPKPQFPSKSRYAGYIFPYPLNHSSSHEELSHFV